MVRLTSEEEGRIGMGPSVFEAGMAGYRWGREVSEVLNLEEERAYGGKHGFPTDRRPMDYRRMLMRGTEDCSLEGMIGNYEMTLRERNLVRDLLNT